jgi:hypothetical protein
MILGFGHAEEKALKFTNGYIWECPLYGIHRLIVSVHNKSEIS